MRGALARAAVWAVPWLAVFAISAGIARAMAAAVAGAQAVPVRTQPTGPVIENSITSEACHSSDNWTLLYVLTTQRIPASYCPSQESMPPGP